MAPDRLEGGAQYQRRGNAMPVDLPLTSSADARLRNVDASTGEGARLSQPPIHRRSSKRPTISIAMIDEHSFTRECIARSLRELSNDLEIVSFGTCEDCLQSTGNHELFLYHVHDQDYNKGRLGVFTKLLAIAPVIILSDLDTPESAFKALESGARGYVPTASTTLELAVEIIRLVKAGGTFVPASSLFLARINRQPVTTGVITTQQFTPRQMAVLERLKEGKANKAIAHALEMSESTVKVHLRNIMKKMKATNRTEVACLALTPRLPQEG
jgi:DNA-binding NarL/FixJ family response regulator